MADQYFKIYFADDGSLVSEEGDFSNPVEFILRADLEEDEEVRLYAEAEPDYEVSDVVVEPQGDNSNQWSLAPDDNGSSGSYEGWGSSLSLGKVEEGSEGRVYFWARARATDDEGPKNDGSVVLHAEGVAYSTEDVS